MSNKDNSKFSTEVFSDKAIPDFIQTNKFFASTKYKIKKIFPSMGLSNFSEPCSINKVFTDQRKENTAPFRLLRVLADHLIQANRNTQTTKNTLQLLSTKELRANSRDTLIQLHKISNIFSSLIYQIDPNNQDVMASAVQVKDGKISLKLFEDIKDADGKFVFKKGQSILSAYSQMKEKLTALNVQGLEPYEQMEAFKIFSAENMPSKGYSIVFTSDGTDGAWDILTMSMRGIKSCQRWDGDHPKCLIGSVLSKFVAIMYLTSGTPIDGKGSKMIRRCVVRYAIDCRNKKPCLILDKMYPELDKDILSVFMSTLKSKTSVPIYFGPEIPNLIKYFYNPTETIKNQLSAREWSYQDTPLKSKLDLMTFVLTDKKDNVEMLLRSFRNGLSPYLATSMSNTNISTIMNFVQNVRMSGSTTKLADSIANAISARIYMEHFPLDEDVFKYYRNYIFNFVKMMNSLKKDLERCKKDYNNNLKKIDDSIRRGEYSPIAHDIYNYLHPYLSIDDDSNYHILDVINFICDKCVDYAKSEMKSFLSRK